eukprot:3906879-Lingulodinium_polyedra.AAC.1
MPAARNVVYILSASGANSRAFCSGRRSQRARRGHASYDGFAAEAEGVGCKIYTPIKWRTRERMGQ